MDRRIRSIRKALSAGVQLAAGSKQRAALNDPEALMTGTVVRKGDKLRVRLLVKI